jgi:adenylate cyclase class 2
MSGEIEVKYRVLDQAGLLAALEVRGIRLSAPSHQDDQAYAPVTWEPGTPRIGVTFARLRTQDGGCTFTTKTPVDNVLACEEHETVIADREAMHRAVVAMGYRPTVRVEKTRRTALVGSYSLCLDEVAGVGTFLEVEAVSSHIAGMTEMQDELSAWVEALGVTVERTGATYDQLVQAAPLPA